MPEGLAYVTGTVVGMDRNVADIVPVQAGVGGPGELKVTIGSGMQVLVAAGRAIVGAEANWEGSYLGLLDADKTLDLEPAHATLYRWDLVVAQVTDSHFGDGSDAFVVRVITGTPGGQVIPQGGGSPVPQPPAAPARSIPLAYVSVEPADSTPSAIADRRQLARERKQRYVAQGAFAGTYDLTSATDVDWPLPAFQTLTKPAWAVYADVTLVLYSTWVTSASSSFNLRQAIGTTEGVYEHIYVDGSEVNYRIPPYWNIYRFPSIPAGANAYKLRGHRYAGSTAWRCDTTSWYHHCVEFCEGLA